LSVCKRVMLALQTVFFGGTSCAPLRAEQQQHRCSIA
jgi:hypothetical protein